MHWYFRAPYRCEFFEAESNTSTVLYSCVCIYVVVWYQASWGTSTREKATWSMPVQRVRLHAIEGDMSDACDHVQSTAGAKGHAAERYWIGTPPVFISWTFDEITPALPRKKIWPWICETDISSSKYAQRKQHRYITDTADARNIPVQHVFNSNFMIYTKNVKNTVWSHEINQTQIDDVIFVPVACISACSMFPPCEPCRSNTW